MLKQLFALFEQPSPKRQPHTLALATAVLLAEIVRADHQVDNAEKAAMKTALQHSLKLTPEEASSLVDEALNTAQAANDLQQFTRVIHDKCNPDEKFQLLCNLWKVAYESDGLDKYEEHMIRKIADLLYIPHSEFMRAKAIIKAQKKNAP